MLLRPVLPFLGLIALVSVAVSALLAIPPRAGDQVAAISTAEVVALTNTKREEKGIVVLKRNALLDAAAQMKAEDMAEKGYYAHVSPDGVTPMFFVERAGYRYLAIGENLVVQRTDAKQVVDAFMGSPGHRANILRKDFTEIGVGVAKGTYKGKDTTFTVQIFGTPKGAAIATPKPAPKPAAAAPKPVTASSPVPQTPKSASKPVKPSSQATSTPVAVPQAAKPAPKPVVPTIVKDVQKLVEPLVPEATATSTFAATSSVSITTSTEYVPTVFSIESVSPIELAGVSRLETRTTPVPVGSNWTTQLQSFIEQVVLSARNLF